MPIYILEHQRFLIFSSIKTKIPLSCVLNKVHIKCITISHDAELQTLNYALWEILLEHKNVHSL